MALENEPFSPAQLAYAHELGDPIEPPKPKKYRCRGRKYGCTFEADEPWAGRCSGCGGNYNYEKTTRDKDEQRTTLAASPAFKPRVRVLCGIDEVDRVLGGGFVLGSSTLFGGPRGTGKSTVLLQVADGISQATKSGAKNGRVVVASGEESRDDLVERAQRIGIDNDRIDVLGNQSDVYEIVRFCEQEKPKMLIVDSINMVAVDDVDADIGQVAQIDASALYLTTYAKQEGIALIMVCHMNGAGDFAGGQKLQHIVDTLVFFMPQPLLDESGQPVRETTSVCELSIYEKNRYGSKDVQELLEMTAEGLKPLSRRLRRKYSSLEIPDGDDEGEG